MDWVYTLSGLVVGFIVGLTGVGGGSLMTPILVLAFGISPAFAVGTDLLYASVTKAGGSLIHGWRGNVDWSVAGLLAAGSLPASALTTLMLKYFTPDIRSSSGLITVTLGVALILTALALVLKVPLRDYARRRFAHRPPWSAKAIAIATFVTGILLGVCVTVSSIGAGALGAAILFFLYPKFSAIKIVGTDIAHAVPLTAVAGIGHIALGTVNWDLLASLLVGSLPGIYFGSYLGSRIPERVLRPTLAVMLVFVGGRLVF